MAYLTIHRMSGDADELLDRKQAHFDPVTSRIAPAYGAVLQTYGDREAE